MCIRDSNLISFKCSYIARPKILTQAFPAGLWQGRWTAYEALNGTPILQAHHETQVGLCSNAAGLSRSLQKWQLSRRRQCAVTTWPGLPHFEALIPWPSFKVETLECENFWTKPSWDLRTSVAFTTSNCMTTYTRTAVTKTILRMQTRLLLNNFQDKSYASTQIMDRCQRMLVDAMLIKPLI